MIDTPEFIHSDSEILGGVPVFVGTRVPFRALIDYLAEGQNLPQFLEDFPSVTKEQAVGALHQMGRLAVGKFPKS